MFHYRRYGISLPPGDSLGGIFATLLQALDEAGVAPTPLRFVFDDAPGGAGCPRLLERFPDFAPFAVRSQSSLRLSNLDGRWQGGNPGCIVEPARDLLLAAAAGVPEDFPLWLATILIGPLQWTADAPGPNETAAQRAPIGRPPFSGLAPSITYFAPGVILQRLSTGGLRLWITEQLAAEDPDAKPAPAVQTLLVRFGPALQESIVSLSPEQEIRDVPPPVPDTAAIHAAYKARLVEIVDSLALPYGPPDPSEFAQLPHEPLGKIRSVIASTFKPDGWRPVSGIPAGSHKLCKETPAGRRLELSFDTGSWSRHVLCNLSLMTGRGTARIFIPADRNLRMQYLTPNPTVFHGVLGNMRLVVAHLVSTWVPEMEAALGPPETPAAPQS